jgi:hypothetical protein
MLSVHGIGTDRWEKYDLAASTASWPILKRGWVGTCKKEKKILNYS